ncbi:MAG TPA: catalase family peroxidase [Terriglobales bacterium]|nr:catalase family peroxidase [Terriglobales bacterium]
MSALPFPPAEAAVSEAIVDTMQSIFGVHRGFRPVHAKGIVCEGSFQAAPAARALSRAPYLQGTTVPVLARFSNFSGLPTVADADPTASPHGLALRFQLAAGASTDLVAHSYDGFPVATADEFLAFLRALAASGPGVPAPTPLQQFAANRPAVRRFLEATPPPRSFATQAYFGVDAFRFTNQQQQSRVGRLRLLPLAGELRLSAAEAAQRPHDFLFDELAVRLERGPAQFRLSVQLAAPGDPIEDPTQAWPAAREQFELGSLRVVQLHADSFALQQSLHFDPARLPDGIAPADPLLAVRSAVYAVAGRRRQLAAA